MMDECMKYKHLNINLFNTTQLQSSSIKEIKYPFPSVKNPDSLVVTFEVKFKTEVISKFPAIEKFKEVNKLISSLRED